MAARNSELDGIIGAIREVQVNLDRRDARAYGAVLVMWALVGGGCFLYAHSTVWFTEHHAGHSDAYMTWFWTVPFAIAGMVTLFVGARRWRLQEETRNDARLWLLLGSLIVPVAATVVLLLLQQWWLVTPLWVAWVGLYLLARDFRDGGLVRTTRQVVGAAFPGCALVIGVTQPSWAYLATGLILLLGLGGLGLAKFMRGE